MNAGMLWLDDDPKRPFDEKVKRAAAHYETKHGRAPNTCFVNPKMIAQETTVGRVEVRLLPTVLHHHFWIGREES